MALVVFSVHNLRAFPVKRGYDGLNHANYINFLKAEKRLPRASDGWEMYHPPLYYLIGTFFPSINSYKFFGLFGYGALVLITYLTVKHFFKEPLLHFLSLILPASLPLLIYLMPQITNELLSAVLISLSFCYYLSVRQKSKFSHAVILGLLLGLSLLVKATALVVIVAIVLDSKRQRFKWLLLALAVVFLVGGWFYIRNYFYYGSPLITNIDLPQFEPKISPTTNNLLFYLTPQAFLKFDLFQAHHYSFFAGTYFSWFFDSHNVVYPVVSFSKIGILLIAASLPLSFFALSGLYQEIKLKSTQTRIFLIYTLLLSASYFLFNLKYAYYWTVKASYLTSLIVPYVYFVLRGVQQFKSLIKLLFIYICIYALLVTKAFWILPNWYN